MAGQINNNFGGPRFRHNQGPGGPGGPRAGRGPNQAPPPTHHGPGGPFDGSSDVSGPGNRFGHRMQNHRANGPGPGGNLSPQQRQEVHALFQEARADGNVSQEERAAIGEKLQSFHQGQQSGQGPFQQGGPLSELSDSQRAEIEQLFQASRSDGQVTAEERANIHQTIEGMVGHPLPQPGQGGFGQGFQGGTQFGGFGLGGFGQGAQFGGGYGNFQQFQGSMGNLQQLFQGFFGG